MILRECLYGASRFDDFRRGLSIAPNVLSARLGHMVERDLLQQEIYQERPPRYRYALTDKGRGAVLVLAAMLRFGNDHVFEAGREPVVLRDRETGRLLRPVVVDELTGEPLDPSRLLPTRGPGFPACETDESESAKRKRALSKHGGPLE